MAEWVIAIAAILAAATSAYASYQSGQASKDAAEFNAKIAENNAKMQAAQADAARQEGASLAEQARERGEALKAAQRVAAGSSGLLVDTGTPMELVAESAGLAELDALTVINNASRKAQGFDVGATESLVAAKMMRMQGSAAAKTANWTAAGQLLGGVATAGFQYQTLSGGKPASPAKSEKPYSIQT